MDQTLLEQICHRKKSGGRSVLVTIVDTRGSTPRKAGSKMLVLPDGRCSGTIGGGCAEAEAKQQALMALDDNQSGLYTVNLLNEAAADEGMVCGGIMEIFIQVI